LTGAGGYPPQEARYHHYFVSTLYRPGKFGYQAGAGRHAVAFFGGKTRGTPAVLWGGSRRRPRGEREDVVS
jgi:hypothetical protein